MGPEYVSNLLTVTDRRFSVDGIRNSIKKVTYGLTCSSYRKCLAIHSGDLDSRYCVRLRLVHHSRLRGTTSSISLSLQHYERSRQSRLQTGNPSHLGTTFTYRKLVKLVRPSRLRQLRSSVDLAAGGALPICESVWF